MRRSFSFLLCAVLTNLGGLWALWGCGALLFQLPAPAWMAQMLAGAFVLLVACGVVCLIKRRWPWPALAMAASLGLLAWWGTIAPSHQRDWMADVARLPAATIAGDTLTITNLRNFRWTSETVADERWETRAYDLTRLKAMDLALSYWSGEAIAHLIVSFSFEGSPPLALSIEVRREKGEQWSPVAGFFKRYELAYIAADERDIIGLRTHLRGEDVRLFQLRATPGQARDVLGAYAADMNALAATPRWYDTLTTNCTTLAFNLVRPFAQKWGLSLPLDPRLLLTGFLPGYLQGMGALRGDMALDVLVPASKISERAKAITLDDPDFSQKIRVGLPARMQAVSPP